MSHLKTLYQLNIEIKPRFFGNKSMQQMVKLIEAAVSRKIPVICLYDEDVSQWDEVEKQRMADMRKKYSKEDVLFVNSMPSIEYWFLLHFEETNKFFGTSKAVIQDLTKYISDYKKEKQYLEKDKWTTHLCDDGKMELAYYRAKKFGIKGESYTRFPLVLEKLLPKMFPKK